jgi:hypothetical protein
VPRRIAGSVATVAKATLARAAMALGDPPAKKGAVAKQTSVTYDLNSPSQAGTDSATLAFLSRVDTNHDMQVTTSEISAFIAANVDRNHDGKVSMYELALYQLRDPAASALLGGGG